MGELSPGTLRRLDALAAEAAPALLAQALEAAEQRVVTLLTEALTTRLLAAAARADVPTAESLQSPVTATLPGNESLRAAAATTQDVMPDTAAEPEPPGTRQGAYVYAVTAGDFEVSSRLSPGVNGSEVQGLHHGTLTAVFSSVTLDEFGEHALRQNLNNLSWLETVARQHEEVVGQLTAETTAIPLRLCTLFNDPEAVRDMLSRNRNAFEGVLARLKDTSEWGVKIIADRGAAADAAKNAITAVSHLGELRATAAGKGEGTAYLADKEVSRHIVEETNSTLATWAREAHVALAGVSVDAVTNPPTSRELADYDGDMVLNGAYLVSTGQTTAFRDVVSQLSSEHREHGMTLHLTGPWPPYNFTTLDP